MPPLLLGLTAACLALLLLWLGLLLREGFGLGRRSLVLSGLALGVFCSLVLPVALSFEAPVPLLVALVAGQSGIAFFYWQLARSLSGENARIDPRHWAVLVVKVALTLASVNPRRPFLLPGLSMPEQDIMRMLPPALFSVVLVVLGLWTLLDGLRHDLVEQRRRSRVRFALVSGTVIFAVIVARLVLHGERLDRLFDGLRLTLTLAALYGLSLRGLRIRPEFLGSVRDGRPAQLSPEETEYVRRLRRLCEEERLYRTEGLTIGDLARRLELPEYRVRRLINGSLGYRNFNDFLNRYRIDEARELLVARRDLPVLRLAMDLGFRSLSSFNKAFKDLTGTTPSAYRQQARREKTGEF